MQDQRRPGQQTWKELLNLEHPTLFSNAIWTSHKPQRRLCENKHCAFLKNSLCIRYHNMKGWDLLDSLSALCVMFFLSFLVKGLAVTIEGGEAHGRLTGFYNSNGCATALKVQRAVKLTAEQGNVKDFIAVNRVAASIGVWARPKYLVRLQWPLK